MRRHDSRRWFLSVWLAAWTCVASAQSDTERDESRRIVAERVAAESRYAAEERACRQRFIVSSCIDDAKRTRRATLAPLRERQIVLDAARRQRSAAERKESLAKKPADDAQRGGVSMSSRAARRSAAAASPSATSSLSVTLDGPSPVGQSKAPARAKPVPSQRFESRIEDEAGNRAAFAARQQEAVRHRAEVDARNAERQRSGKPAKGLPTATPASGVKSMPSTPSIPAASATR